MSNHFHLLVRVPHRSDGFVAPLVVVVARLERALEERVGNDGMEPWRGFAELKFPGNLLPHQRCPGKGHSVA